MKFSERQEFRFLVAGGANTAIGYGLYLLLNLAFDYRIAYSLSFAAGIVLSFVLNSLYVFREPLRWTRLLVYPAVYVLQYAIGIACVWAFVDLLNQPEALAPFPAIAISLPLTYIATRYIIKGGPGAAAKH
jgi:putative flippase GtrA